MATLDSTPFVASLRSHFEGLARNLCEAPSEFEEVSLYLEAESSTFVRFNRAAVRQAIGVRQAEIVLSVRQGSRMAQSTLSLSLQLERDLQRVREACAALKDVLIQLPDDPFLLRPSSVQSTDRARLGALPDAAEVVEAVRTHAADTDFVGLYAGGPSVRAYADSRGQRNWHAVDSFHFGWSLYRQADEAVKQALAGSHWRTADFAQRLDEGRGMLGLLARDRMHLKPGAYRSLFSSLATADLIGRLGWGGFGQQAAHTGESALTLLHRDIARFAPQIHMREATAEGLAPCFTAEGFVRPNSVDLVREGQHVQCLVGPRSAREHGLAATAGDSESPESLHIAPGLLPAADQLKLLGTGLWVQNVHYLNYSDRRSARLTGMTRFACFWVEGGEIVAPLHVMRFDDSLLRMYGEGLIGLGDEAELHPTAMSYGHRYLSAVSAPWSLVEGFRLVL